MVIQIWKKEDLLVEANFRFRNIFSRSVSLFLMAAPSFSIRISLYDPSILKVQSCYQWPNNYHHGLMDNSSTEMYIGPTVHDFKARYRYHTASFRHAIHRNSTELRKHIWTLKDNNIGHFISWRILSSSSPYNSASRRCNLRLHEKFQIICRPELPSVNERNELRPPKMFLCGCTPSL